MNSLNWREVLQHLCGRSLGNTAMNVTWWFSPTFKKHCQTVAHVPVTQWPSDPFLFFIFLSLLSLSVLTMMCLGAWIRIIWIVCGLQWYVGWCQFLQDPPKGGRVCLMCPAIWNHGAVLWFHFPVSSLAFLSCHFFLLMVHYPDFSL